MTLTQKYQRRFYITVFSAIGFTILWAFHILWHPFVFLHEYGHCIMGGMLFPAINMSPDGAGEAYSLRIFGETMASAGGFTGLIVLCGLLQLIPIGLFKGIGIAAVIRAIFEAINWSTYGYRVDFSHDGVKQLVIISSIILIPLFIVSVFKGWELNKLWDRKKAAKVRFENEKEQRRLARLNRIKTA